MGFLDQYGISPDASLRLANLAGVKQAAPEDDPYSAESWNKEIQTSPDLSPETKAAAERANGAGGSPQAAVAASNPSSDPNWTPEKEEAKTAEANAAKALAAADPQGPAGSDGFPTYRTPGGQSGQGGAPVQPGTYVPAHWQGSTREHSTERAMDPASLEAAQFHEDLSAGHALEAHDARLESAAVQGQMDSIQAAAKRRADEVFDARQKQIDVARQAYMTDQLGQLDALSTQAQAKINPREYWDNQSTFGKVLATVAIGLGQFGASMKGGPNTAYEIINGEINRNIKAQEDNAANAGRAFGIKSNLYAQNLEAFKDKDRALAATRVQYLDQVVQAIQQQSGHIKGSVDAQAANAEFLSKFEADRAKAATEFAKLTAVKSTEKAGEVFKPAAVIGGDGGQHGKEGLYVPSLGGYARDDQTARLLNGKAAMRMSINENLRQINGLLEKAKTINSVTSPLQMQQIEDQIQALANDTYQSSTVLKGQGAMSEGDKKVAEVANSLARAHGQFRTEKQIANTQENVRQVAIRQMRDHRLEGEAYGVQLGREEYRQGPNGPEPVRHLEGRNKTLSKETQSFDDVVELPKGKAK